MFHTLTARKPWSKKNWNVLHYNQGFFQICVMTYYSLKIILDIYRLEFLYPNINSE